MADPSLEWWTEEQEEENETTDPLGSVLCLLCDQPFDRMLPQSLQADKCATFYHQGELYGTYGSCAHDFTTFEIVDLELCAKLEADTYGRPICDACIWALIFEERINYTRAESRDPYHIQRKNEAYLRFSSHREEELQEVD